jgi:hypothetical protein
MIQISKWFLFCFPAKFKYFSGHKKGLPVTVKKKKNWSKKQSTTDLENLKNFSFGKDWKND